MNFLLSEEVKYMPFSIIREDITRIKADAIVNAANTELKMGGGVCGAIFKAAGADKLKQACDALAPIRTGEAVITPGFDLSAKFIIHTAGPVYHGGAANEEALLRSCYRTSLALAEANHCESIAFPLISSGIYRFPKVSALTIAVDTIREFLEDHEMSVFLTLFDKEALQAGEKLFGEVESYIDEHYAESHYESPAYRRLLTIEQQQINRPAEADALYSPEPTKGLQDLIGNLDEPFSVTLLKLIDAKGMKDVEVYKRANLDRKLFSKIRTNQGYMPGKRTALALCIALKLDLAETDDLLERAGYTLSHASKSDVIVEYFIVNRRYDIFEINETLFQFDQQLLGM